MFWRNAPSKISKADWKILNAALKKSEKGFLARARGRVQLYFTRARAVERAAKKGEKSKSEAFTLCFARKALFLAFEIRKI